MQKPNKWKMIFMGIGAAIMAALGIIVSVLLGKKPEPPTDSSDDVKDYVEEVKTIQAMTDEEVVEKYQTPAQKEKKDDIVENQVAKAMKGAEKYKRKSG